ncbi:MAG: hypothetical protein M0Z99_19660 [Betaproteobacteria bacterium]|nr:hypothetical protein [Betaproteobacteria bacterium]
MSRALIDLISPVSRQIFAGLPTKLQREVLRQRGFCSKDSFEDLIQEAALTSLAGKKKSLRGWNQSKNSPGWGTVGRDAAEQEAIDAVAAAAEAASAADSIDPLRELLIFEAAAARIARDPAAVGRAQRNADLARRTGRAREVACRDRISTRRAQQVFDMHREAIRRGQMDLFDGPGEGGVQS